MEIEAKSRSAAHGELINRFPGVPDDYDKDFNKLFANFIFAEKRGRVKECTCTSCYGKFELPDRITDSALLHARHGDIVRCPLCGKRVEYKVVGKCGGMHNLDQFRRSLVIIPTDDPNLVFGAVVFLSKKYSANNFREMRIDKHIEIIYAWTPGTACGWVEKWNFECGTWTSHFEEAKSPAVRKGSPYLMLLVGVERLKDTFLRYSAIDVLSDKFSPLALSGDDVARWFAEYCVHPGIEMLAKIGHLGIIKETLFDGKRGGGCLDWTADKPWKFYRMDKQEYKKFIMLEPTIERLEWRKAIKRCWKCSDISDADEEIGRYGSNSSGYLYGKVAEQLAEYLSRRQLANYIDRQCGTKAQSVRRYVLQMLYDYLTMAREIGYDLTEPNVRLPKNLKAAHDTAAELQRIVLREREAERMKEHEVLYKKRRKELEKLYAHVGNDYIVRVPESASEIVAEGEALHHCVGGYAARHIEGNVTILLIRRAEEPDVPFFTVEMGVGGNKWQLRQIHGLRNCLPDKKLNEFVTDWLAFGEEKENNKEMKHYESKVS